MQHLDFAIIGNDGIGKTSFLDTYFWDDFQRKEIMINYTKNFTFEGHTINLSGFDLTYSNKMYKVEVLCPRSFYLICFSLNSFKSFQNVQKIFYPMIQKHDPNKPIILVGLKSDLRIPNSFNNYMELIPTLQGEVLKKIIGARAYIECSALSKQNLDDVIEAGLRCTLENPGVQSFHKHKECNIG